MVGKLTTIMAKKEAEVYCAHGLHQEALNLYQRLLATSPHMDPAFKRAIENQVVSIKARLQTDHPEEHSRLSAKDILRLKEGWGAKATQGDLLVCAQAFYRIGHFRSALSELTRLLEKGCDKKAVVGLFADCLVGMCQPQRLVKTTVQLTGKVFSRPLAHVEFMLLLTEKMVANGHGVHAAVLYRFLQNNKDIKSHAPRRLAAIARSLDAQQSSHQQ